MLLKEIIEKYNINFKVNKDLEKALKSVKIQDKANYYKSETTPYTIDNPKLEQFISNDLYQKIVKNLKFKNYYTWHKRKFTIYSKGKINISYIKKLDRICNFFDSAIGKEKTYKIDLYISGEKKSLCEKYPVPNKDNINSGANIIERGKIVIYREEEWEKIVVHELIHYVNWHIFTIREHMLYPFKDINTSSRISPNEGYTEYFALILYYYIKGHNLNASLTMETAWGFIQSAKILKYKGFETYNSLYSGKMYSQDSFLLSYFILKTYFLYNNRYQKCLKLSENDDYKCFLDINLQSKKFSEIMEYCIENLDLNDKCLKMSLDL